jgi:alpha-mannosidase
MVGQAHLDPIWLWGWSAGLDEALATCRSACDLLDDYPEFIFTRGEAWCYRQVERADPELFARIKQHVAAGRWEITGGWWIQPDCNQPSGFGMEQQIEAGKRYFLDRFGLFPEVGYNVDSFGHAASLPRLMHAAGQRYYVFMRPQEHEKPLPTRLFRWRGEENSPEVVTFRIAGAYGSGGQAVSEEHLRRALSELPEGITHTMCFYGCGDHGGGATAQLVEWIIANKETFPGMRLEFSSPSRFFAAIADQIDTLPVVTGELQHHAIGCYSVQRAIKTGVRETEHRLRQAEIMAETTAEPEATQLDAAWEQVSFAQFHDILGGTSIPSAYPPIIAQLGAASSTADDLLHYGLREKMRALPGDPLQRIILFNASDAPYDGFAEVEPWMPWQGGGIPWRLLDAQGQEVTCQTLSPEANTRWLTRLLFPARLAPGELRTFKIERVAETPVPSPIQAGPTSLENESAAVDLGPAQLLGFPGVQLALPGLALIPDYSDNWSHRIDRFPEGPVTSPNWYAPCLQNLGSLRASLLQTGTIGRSTLRAEWRLYADKPLIELFLTVHWQEERKILKLICPLPGQPAGRLDGILGGSLARENDAKERPLRDWTLCKVDDDCRLGIVCPDVYALDGTPQRLRFTLLRSPIMTHHEPDLGQALQGVYADQGVHTFRFQFTAGSHVTADELDRAALMLQRPLLMADLTRGMPR